MAEYCDIVVRLLQHRMEEQKLRAEFVNNYTASKA